MVSLLEYGRSWVRAPVKPDYIIGICCFSAKHEALWSKSKDCLPLNRDDVSQWSDMSTRGLLFQTTTIIKMQLNVLVYYKKDRLKSKNVIGKI